MAALLKSKGKEAHPEFFEPPSCPFYEVRMDPLTRALLAVQRKTFFRPPPPSLAAVR
jgi:hypothetical protein